MFFHIRPSKIFLYERLIATLSAIHGDVGLDVGSATLKHRWMFQTTRYVGIDLDRDRLRSGLERLHDDAAIGIHADIAHLDPLPDHSADVVVSTNTLYCLSSEDRLRAFGHMIRLTKPHTGVLLAECTIGPETERIIALARQRFTNVRIAYFKNPLTRWYEERFERNGELTTHPIAGSKPFKLIAWLLSRTELLTQFCAAGNKHILIICRDKREGVAQDFDLSRLPHLTSHLIELVPDADTR